MIRLQFTGFSIDYTSICWNVIRFSICDEINYTQSSAIIICCRRIKYVYWCGNRNNAIKCGLTGVEVSLEEATEHGHYLKNVKPE